MHRSLLNLFSFTPPPKEDNMFRNLVLALCAIAFFFLAACGVPISYDPCYGPSSCGTNVVADDGTTGDTDTPPPADDSFSCEELTQLAVLACSGDIVSVDCVNSLYVCGDHTDDGTREGGDTTTITIVITVEADGTVTAADDDPSTPDCADGVDNDFDGDIDFGSDTDCESATDTSEAGSGGDDGGDDGDDTSSGDCVESAGGIEYCDGVDNDCDGITDEGDFDEDGWISDDCSAYDGSSTQTGDCNDSGAYSGYLHSALINPDALELGDWIDSDCDGQDDEDDGCTVQCDTNSDLTNEEFEQDGDVAYECVSAFFVADQSSDSNPLDESVSWAYDNGTSDTSYSGIAVSCEETAIVESDPTQWEDIDDIVSEMCDRLVASSGGAYTSSECLALF